jgi:His-Xaa-Ser system protein HxsD
MKDSMSTTKIEGDSMFISVNPKTYPLDVIYAAAYVILDKAYVVLDGNPEERVIVEIKATADLDLRTLEKRFYEELLNYAVYKTQSEKNAELRQTMLQRALLTNGFDMEAGTTEYNLDDPDGITIPWEEKYGEEDKQS